MIRWGMVPNDFDDLLMFAGMKQEARRLMGGRIGCSLRDAAVNCPWHAQSLTPKAPPTRQTPTGERNQTVISSDRGIWKGTTACGAKLVAQQLARHETALQPACTKAINDAAALAELNKNSNERGACNAHVRMLPPGQFGQDGGRPLCVRNHQFNNFGKMCTLL